MRKNTEMRKISESPELTGVTARRIGGESMDQEGLIIERETFKSQSSGGAREMADCVLRHLKRW